MTQRKRSTLPMEMQEEEEERPTKHSKYHDDTIKNNSSILKMTPSPAGQATEPLLWDKISQTMRADFKAQYHDPYASASDLDNMPMF